MANRFHSVEPEILERGYRDGDGQSDYFYLSWDLENGFIPWLQDNAVC